jgi:predicted transcriptional regulator
VFNAFVDAGMISLSEAELKVWLILFRDVKAATGTAQTGRGDMAKRAGMKPDTIRKAMKKLKRAGRVKLLRTGRPGGGPSVYSVHPTGS